jgi:DeoR family suf operon transcriptional repressor
MVHQSRTPSANDELEADRPYAAPGFTMRQRSVIAALPRAERDIVLALKLHGPTNIVDLSERLQASASALRPHLGQLEIDGLVTHHSRIKGPGRPQHLFSLTPEGEQLFPTAVARFGVELVRYLFRHNPELLRRFSAEMEERFLTELTGDSPGDTFDDALASVVDGLVRGDFLPELKDGEGDEDAQVTLHHCPLAAIAREFPQICDMERATLEAKVPGSSVERLLWRLDDAPVCIYRFARRAESAPLRFPMPGETGERGDQRALIF